jgi:hypothetical protein
MEGGPQAGTPWRFGAFIGQAAGTLGALDPGFWGTSRLWAGFIRPLGALRLEPENAGQPQVGNV